MDGDTEVGAAGGAWCWTFGEAEFDEGRWQLRVRGEPVDLERRPLEVLQYLLRHAGEAVTKDELLAAAWSGRVVVEAVLTNAIGKLRKALGGDAQAVITTLPRVGYRIAVPVARRPVQALPPATRLQAGAAVPRRPNWTLDALLARTAGHEVWLARQSRTGEARVFKFCLAASGLSALKREVAIARLLREALGERDDFVRLIDWDFEQAPYFLEWVHGGTGLDRWPGDGGGIGALPREARLRLFLAAADAVAAAHGVGVLHRDLKPANLLVEGTGGEARVRVADFGSGQLVDPGRVEALGITHVAGTLASAHDSGTPLYLAPELASGQAPSTRSDVYALGVTLYQLLVGDFRRPLAPGWEADIDDPLLREDIAAAAHGDPARRLASVAALAERIRGLDARREQRALEQAIRDRIAEGDRRLARVRARRPWVVAACVALAAGLGMTAWQLSRSLEAERIAAEQRELAATQARRAEAVVQYLSNDLIRSLAPEGGGFERDPTIREMVEFAAASLDARFPDDPATRGSLHAAIGASWEALRDPVRGMQSYAGAWRDYAAAFGEADERALLARYDLAAAMIAAGRFDEAEAELDAADGLAGDRLSIAGRLALWSAWKRGRLQQARMELDGAQARLERALALQAEVAPGDQVLGARITLALADVYQRQGRFTEVVARVRAALADPQLRGEELRNDYRVLLSKMLAFQNAGAETIAEAVALAREAAASTARLRGEDALLTLARRAEVARALSRGGDCVAALAEYRDIWARAEARHGLLDRAVLSWGSALAGREVACGDRARGEALRAQVFDLRLRHFPDDPLTHAGRYQAATAWIAEGRTREASRLLDGIDAAKMAAGMSSPAAAHWIEVQRGRIEVLEGAKAAGRRRVEAALAGMAGMGIDPASPGLEAMRRWLEEQGA